MLGTFLLAQSHSYFQAPLSSCSAHLRARGTRCSNYRSPAVTTSTAGTHGIPCPQQRRKNAVFKTAPGPQRANHNYRLWAPGLHHCCRHKHCSQVLITDLSLTKLLLMQQRPLGALNNLQANGSRFQSLIEPSPCVTAVRPTLESDATMSHHYLLALPLLASVRRALAWGRARGAHRSLFLTMKGHQHGPLPTSHTAKPRCELAAEVTWLTAQASSPSALSTRFKAV